MTPRSAYLYDGFYSSHKRQTGETFPRTGSAAAYEEERQEKPHARASLVVLSFFLPFSFSMPRSRLEDAKARR